MADFIGTTLGNYRIVDSIGGGGMGSVYKAYHEGLDVFRAVKVIKTERSDSEDFRTRFRHEAQSGARLQHPHIVQVHDFGEDHGQFFMAMEYVEGKSLRDYLSQQGPLAIERALEITLQIAKALGYAHSQGIIHRDIKPDNILIRRSNGEAVITDFGIAKLLYSQTRVTQTGQSIGTPAYMPPEQAMGNDEVSPATDIYALAAILFEMLTGQAPFVAESPMAVMLKAINEPLPVPSSLNPDVDKPLDEAVRMATHKDPNERFQSADEFVAALAGSQYSGAESNTTQIAAAPNLIPKRGRPFFAAALAVVALVGGAYLFSGGGEPVDVETDRSVSINPAGSSSAISSNVRNELERAITGFSELEYVALPNEPTAYAIDLRLAEDGESSLYANLIRQSDNTTVWSERFSTGAQGGDFQTSVLAHFLRLQIVRDSQCESVRRTSASAEAAELVCRALLEFYKLHQGGEWDAELQRISAQKAIEADPTIPEPYWLLADVTRLGTMLGFLPMDQGVGQLELIFARSEQLVGEDPMILWQQAFFEAQVLLDYPSATRKLERALEIDPLHPGAHWWHALLGDIAIREGNARESQQHYRRAITIFNADAKVQAEYSFVLYLSGQYEDAVEVGNQALNLLEDGAFRAILLSIVAISELRLGNLDSANAAADSLLSTVGPEWRFLAARPLAALGREEEARASLEQMLSWPSPPSNIVATTYMELGQLDEAFVWLQKAIEFRREFILRAMRVGSEFEPMREDPRWDALLRNLDQIEASNTVDASAT